MKNYVQAGENVTVTAAADTLSGAAVLVGVLLGIAQNAAKAGEKLTLVRRGVFSVDKATGQAWAVGAKVYWNATDGNFTTTATGNKLAGCVVEDALDADTSGVVLLDGVIR